MAERVGKWVPTITRILEKYQEDHTSQGEDRNYVHPKSVETRDKKHEDPKDTRVSKKFVASKVIHSIETGLIEAAGASNGITWAQGNIQALIEVDEPILNEETQKVLETGRQEPVGVEEVPLVQWIAPGEQLQATVKYKTDQNSRRNSEVPGPICEEPCNIRDDLRNHLIGTHS